MFQADKNKKHFLSFINSAASHSTCILGHNDITKLFQITIDVLLFYITLCSIYTVLIYWDVHLFYRFKFPKRETQERKRESCSSLKTQWNWIFTLLIYSGALLFAKSNLKYVIVIRKTPPTPLQIYSLILQWFTSKMINYNH